MDPYGPTWTHIDKCLHYMACLACLPGLLACLHTLIREAIHSQHASNQQQLLSTNNAHRSAIASQQSKKGGRRQEAEGP